MSAPLAASFDGQKNQVQAMKAAVYSSTATWVAGVLNVIPVLGILALIASVYGLYILWLGLPKLMKVPAEKLRELYIAVRLPPKKD